jgi:hypothetical protein
VEPPTWLASEQARVVTVHAIIVRELQWRPRANIGTRKISRNNYFVQRKIFALATETQKHRNEFHFELIVQTKLANAGVVPFKKIFCAFCVSVAKTKKCPAITSILPNTAHGLHLTCRKNSQSLSRTLKFESTRERIRCTRNGVARCPRAEDPG